jgi:hypothetical protein
MIKGYGSLSPHHFLHVKPRSVYTLGCNITPCIKQVVEYLQAQMGHAYLINIRKGKTDLEVNPGQIFGDGIDLTAQIAAGLAHQSNKIFHAIL